MHTWLKAFWLVLFEKSVQIQSTICHAEDGENIDDRKMDDVRHFKSKYVLLEV